MLILYYFYLELSARKTARKLDFRYKSIHRKFMEFRKSIAGYYNAKANRLNGEIEMDESYFGGKRKGKRGRGTGNKAIVFGILKNGSS